MTCAAALVASSGSAGVNRLKLFLFCKLPETGEEVDNMEATSLIPRARRWPRTVPTAP